MTAPQELSERVTRLPMWRGIPIPYFATIRADGTPDFKVIDEHHRSLCASQRLCWVCGEALGYWIVFLGGPVAAKNRMYVDGPMHEECARDALRICPFLFGRTDYGKEPDKRRHILRVRQIRNASTTPPEVIILYKTRSFKVLSHTNEHDQFKVGSWVFHAAPAVHTEPFNRTHPKEK